MFRPLPTLSLCALSLALATEARAECAVTAFGLVVCTGDDADGLDDATEGLVVEVRPGATVGSADPFDPAIALGEGARVLNQGALDAGGDAVAAGDGLSVENEGAILSLGGGGVVGGDDATLANRAGGAIRATETAVRLGLGAFVANDGEIEGGEGDGVAVEGGAILNTGTIRTLGGSGVVLGAGEPGGDTLLDNSGLVVGGAVGVEAGAGSQTVFNEGAIVGGSGTAIDLGGGSDLVVSVLGGEIDGATLLGSGDDALLFHIDPGATASAAFGLFDGGAGFDEVQFNNFTSGALSAEAVEDGFLVSLMAGATSLSATLLDFESFIFDDAILSAADSGGRRPRPGPDPAPGGPAAAGRRAGRARPDARPPPSLSLSLRRAGAGTRARRAALACRMAGGER